MLNFKYGLKEFNETSVITAKGSSGLSSRLDTQKAQFDSGVHSGTQSLNSGVVLLDHHAQPSIVIAECANKERGNPTGIKEMIEAQGFTNVTEKLTATTTAELTGYDLVVFSSYVWNLQKGTLIRSCIDAGMNVFTTGNDTTSETPLITAATKPNKTIGVYLGDSSHYIVQGINTAYTNADTQAEVTAIQAGAVALVYADSAKTFPTVIIKENVVNRVSHAQYVYNYDGRFIKNIVKWTANKYASVGTFESPSINLTPQGNLLSSQVDYTAIDGTALVETKVSTVSGELTFDGVDDYIDVSPGAAVQKFTWSAQITPTDVAKDQMYLTGGTEVFYARIQNSKVFVSIKSAAGTQKTLGGSTLLQNNTTYNVSITYDGVSLKIFLNGVQDAIATFNEAAADFVLRTIGYWIDSDKRAFKGKIKDVRIYNRALTQAEIQTDMNKTLVGNEPGLVGYWKLDESYGPTAYDSTSNGKHGTIYGATRSEIVVDSGKWQGVPSNQTSLSFDGMNDHVYLGVDVTPKNSYTKELWLKTNNPTARNIFSGSNNEVFYLTGGTIQLANYWGEPKNVVTATANFYDNKWHHIVGTFDGANGSIYMDGQLLASGPLDAFTTTDVQTYIGRYAGGNFFIGSIREVRLWNRALTQSEIQANMNAELTGTEAGLVRYWKFNDGIGDLAKDSTPNASHGTIYGATWEDKVEIAVDTELSFDGVNDQIATNFVFENNFTVKLSVRPDNLTDMNGFFDAWQTNLYGGFLIRRDNNPNTSRIFIGDGTNITAQTVINTPANNWTELAATYSNNTFSVYVNGVIVSSISAAFTPAEPLQIGRRTRGGTSYWAGRLKNISIWNRALTQAEIQANTELTGTETGLVRYWKLNEGAGRTAYDSSRNANHETIIGATWNRTLLSGNLTGKSLKYRATLQTANPKKSPQLHDVNVMVRGATGIASSVATRVKTASSAVSGSSIASTISKSKVIGIGSAFNTVNLFSAAMGKRTSGTIVSMSSSALSDYIRKKPFASNVTGTGQGTAKPFRKPGGKGNVTAQAGASSYPVTVYISGAAVEGQLLSVDTHGSVIAIADSKVFGKVTQQSDFKMKRIGVSAVQAAVTTQVFSYTKLIGLSLVVPDFIAIGTSFVFHWEQTEEETMNWNDKTAPTDRWSLVPLDSKDWRTKNA